jgi:uncharacterized integral membrane protein
MADEESTRRAEDIGKQEGKKLETRTWVAILLGVLVLLFALANLDEVEVSFFWIWDVTMPLIFLFAIVGAIGVGVGWLLRSRGRDD